MTRLLRRGTATAALATIATLALPALAFGQDEARSPAELTLEIDTLWVIVGTVLVFFMQAGFAFLEIGFSRGKNVGAGIAKIVVNFSVAAIAWWAIGFGIAFGGDNPIAGTSGFFFQVGDTVAGETADANLAGFFSFQFMFAAVSLAIVWGATLERIKFVVYPIFALVFAGVIYPLIAHWGFGGGVFAEIGDGVQDFAGSSVVHLTGATAAFAACLLIGPRKGKFGPDGKPRAIPGHSMPLLGLGVLILWLGWFGFNGASTLGTAGSSFAEVVGVTNLGAAGGVIGAMIGVYLTTRTFDVGIIANGAIGGLVAITAPAGYVEFYAAPIIGLVGGLIVVYGVLFFEKFIDDPVGATSAHGLAGIWGTLAAGLFTSPRLAESVGVGRAGLFEGGGFYQLGVQAAAVVITFVVVFILSFAVFFLLKITIGLRPTEDEERAGLDISDHGMYGYPEQFIPESELVGPAAASPAAPLITTGPPKQEVPA